MWSWDAGVQQPLLTAADTSAGALRAAFPVLPSPIQPPVTCAAVGCSGPSTEPHSGHGVSRADGPLVGQAGPPSPGQRGPCGPGSRGAASECWPRSQGVATRSQSTECLPCKPRRPTHAALACGPALGSCRSRGRLSFTPPGTVLFRTLSVRDQEASRHHGSKWVPAAAVSGVPWPGVTWPLPPAPPDMSLSEAWC